MSDRKKIIGDVYSEIVDILNDARICKHELVILMNMIVQSLCDDDGEPVLH